jgi:hypothetical protein
VTILPERPAPCPGVRICESLSLTERLAGHEISPSELLVQAPPITPAVANGNARDVTQFQTQLGRGAGR